MSIVREMNNDNESLNTCENKNNANENIDTNYITPEMVLRLPTITDSKLIELPNTGP